MIHFNQIFPQVLYGYRCETYTGAGGPEEKGMERNTYNVYLSVTPTWIHLEHNNSGCTVW